MPTNSPIREGNEEIAQRCIWGDLSKEIHIDIASIKDRVLEALDAKDADSEKALKEAVEALENIDKELTCDISEYPIGQAPAVVPSWRQATKAHRIAKEALSKIRGRGL